MGARRRMALAGGVGRARSMSGAGLIEVMIAVLLLSFGMLGIAGMQALSLRGSQSALQRTQAVIHTYTILDAMRANRASALIGAYDIPMTCAPPEPGDLVANDLSGWITRMQQDNALGRSACGQIDCDSLDCTVILQWDDSRAHGGANQQRVRTVSRL